MHQASRKGHPLVLFVGSRMICRSTAEMHVSIVDAARNGLALTLRCVGQMAVKYIGVDALNMEMMQIGFGFRSYLDRESVLVSCR